MERGSDHSEERAGVEITRRSFVGAAGSMALLAFAPPIRLQALLGSAPAAGQPGRFLTAAELRTLTAVCDRLIPGPPEDPTPGAVAAGVPQAIDLLLGAFEVDPPLIHAGGPYSNRAGSRHDDFAEFVPLDRAAELGWRIRLEGSRGIPGREFAGPVTGLQQIYGEGLAMLDELAGGDFAAAPSSTQEQLLTDARVQTFVGAAFANTLEAMYGPPEYGGNRGLVGWTSNGWAGDNQPRGYTHRQVTGPDRGSVVPLARDELPVLPDLAGRAAARDAWWLGRPRFGR
jgi:hypothetical protein